MSEWIARVLTKGREVLVVGRMESNKYEGKTFWNVVADRVQFIGSKNDTQGGGESSGASQSSTSDDEEDLPF